MSSEGADGHKADAGSGQTQTTVERSAAASRASAIPAQLLVDLVTNPLDPGYAAAARRRGATPARRWYDGPAVAIGCLLIGFVLVVAYAQAHRSAPEATKVKNNLADRVRSAQHDNDQLSGELDSLGGQLATARQHALSGADPVQRTIAAAQLAAGQVAVTGPGLQVTLRDAAQPAASTPVVRPGTVPIAQTQSLSDRDIQSVVNELWAAGAEAISVNDIRLTPTAAIRFAGNAVLVDFQPITSPYQIRAIGDPDVLETQFAASAVASRYQTLISAEGIGFSFATHKKLELPAGTPVTLRYARPAPSPTATPPASARRGGDDAPRDTTGTTPTGAAGATSDNGSGETSATGGTR